MFDLLSDFAKGLVIGVSIAAPVGPIGILCIRTTLTQGMAAGFVTGLGAATADAVYAALGAFGVGAVTLLLNTAAPVLRILGIAVLAWLAWSTWQRTIAHEAEVKPAPSLWLAFASTCGLTLTNPMTILSFAAIFAGAGLAGDGGDTLAEQAAALVAGTFVGSLAWWLFLSGSVAVFRTKLGPRALAAINKASAVMLAGFAVWMAAQAAAS